MACVASQAICEEHGSAVIKEPLPSMKHISLDIPQTRLELLDSPVKITPGIRTWSSMHRVRSNVRDMVQYVLSNTCMCCPP